MFSVHVFTITLELAKEKPVPVLILHLAIFTYQQYEVDNKTVAPIASLLYLYLEAHILGKILSLFFGAYQHIPMYLNEDYKIHLHGYCSLSRHLFYDFTGFKGIVLATVFTLTINYQL